MRSVLCLLALLLFAGPVAAQVCPDSTSIVATGGAPHIVLYPDGSTYSTHSTESAAHRAAVNLSARLGEQVLVTRVAAWRVCSPGATTDTIIVVPPPTDTGPTPPPPPVDTTDVPAPPAPMPVAPFSPPPGWTVLTDYRWPALNDGGWGYIQRGGDLGFIQAVSDPEMGTAAEMVYRQGFPSGNDPGVLWHEGVQGRSGFYAAFRVRFSDNWTHQDPGIKFFFLMADGWNTFIRPAHPNPAWPEEYGIEAGRWTMDRQGWPGGNGSGDGMPVTNAAPFNNVNQQAATIAWDRWQTVEVQLLRGSGGFDGVIRMWVDGVLTAEHTQVRIPSGAFSNLHFAGTYGGGNIPTVPADQWIRISHTMIAVPE